MTAFLASALRLAGAGCFVFPCRPATKIPATSHGFLDATRRPVTIRAMWSAMPAANVGIATGPSGLGVIDLDGAAGITAWRALIAEHPTPRTLTARTPHGAHIYFRDPGGRLRTLAGQLGAGIDTKGIRGCITAPPSKVDGRPYTWYQAPQLDRLPAVPDWIVTALQPPARPAVRAVEVRNPVGGSRRHYGEKALQGEVQAVLDAPVGTRNASVNAAAYSLGTLVGAGVLDEATAVVALTMAGAAVGLPPAEASRTVQSGIIAGIAQPRRVSA